MKLTTSPSRVALCRQIKGLMAAQNATYAKLAAASTRKAGALSYQVVQELLDEARPDVHIRWEDIVDWARVLGPDVLQAAVDAYQLDLDVIARGPAMTTDLHLVTSTGRSLAAVGQLAADVDAALADGVVTTAEVAGIERAVELGVRKLRAVAASARAVAPKRVAR